MAANASGKGATEWNDGLSVGVIGVALLFAACDGDGDALSVEDYFERVQAISDETEAAQDAIAPAEAAGDVSRLFGDQGDVLSDSRDKMRDVNPPEAVEPVHDVFVDALKDFSDKAKELSDDLDGVDDGDEVNSIIEAANLDAVTAPFQVACSGLEAHPVRRLPPARHQVDRVTVQPEPDLDLPRLRSGRTDHRPLLDRTRRIDHTNDGSISRTKTSLARRRPRGVRRSPVPSRSSSPCATPQSRPGCSAPQASP